MIYLVGAILSALLYRIGGAGKEEISFANSQYRDAGVPLVVLFVLCFTGHVWYLALLASFFMLLFIRTYHDWTGEDNMYLHGMFIGLSMVPLVFGGVRWQSVVLYSILLALLMGGLNTLCTRFKVPFSVWVEELARGFFIVFFLFFLWL